jgi:cell division protein FtsQ
MDGGGRLDQPLTWSGPATTETAGAPIDGPSLAHAAVDPRRPMGERLARAARHGLMLGRRAAKFSPVPPPGFGLAAATLLLAAAVGYGAVVGGHVSAIVAWLRDVGDTGANAMGLRIAAVSLTGEKEVSREEVLTIAGVTGRASLLLLDADAARTRLLGNPWIGDAAVLKLYPDRLQITITERQAFALWQKDGRVSVIAADGTVLEPFVEERYLGLPLVVGRGAQQQAQSFLAVINRYPEIRAALRASILVTERRWNLRLKNGIDVRLPETNVAQALDRLVALDREKKLLSRDILAVDLRLPDRVGVRLSDAAAQARDDAVKETKKKKGGDA